MSDITDLAGIKSLPQAVMHFFGKLPGQSTADFLVEFKKLTDDDKAEFRDALKARGYGL